MVVLSEEKRTWLQFTHGQRRISLGLQIPPLLFLGTFRKSDSVGRNAGAIRLGRFAPETETAILFRHFGTSLGDPYLFIVVSANALLVLVSDSVFGRWETRMN